MTYRAVGPSRLRSLSRAVAPIALPITVADLKAQTRVSTSAEDTYLAGLVAAIVGYVDGQGVLGRAMITQTWAQTMQYPNGRVALGMGPVQSLAAVKYFDESNVEQTASLANYRLFSSGDWAFVEPINETWPTAFDRPDAVKIEFVVGYGLAATDVPADVRHAMLLLGAHWYQNRENSSEAQMQDIPMGFEMLMNNHRLNWY